jgi:hypothetical protein
MNERIRELAEESYNEFYSVHIDLELFAELIVQECADLFEIEWGDEKLTGNDVGYVLKKHFGVE